MFLIAVLIVVGIVVYANTLPNKMFWDDDDFILQNAFIKDWHYFPKFFTENVIAGRGLVSNYWRPALLTVFSFEWHAWGSWAPGWHVVNAGFHIVDALLLFLILCSLKLFKSSPSPPPSPSRERELGRWLAFCTACLFVVHPLQTEAVSYVNSLGDSLSVFFMFGGIYIFLRGMDIRRISLRVLIYTAAWLLYVLALLSKETAIIMPALLALCIFFLPHLTSLFEPEHQSRRPYKGEEKKFNVLERIWLVINRTWPFFVTAGIYVLLRATTFNFKNSFNLYSEANTFTSSVWVRILTFFKILVTYFGLLFFPHGLHMERGMDFATSLLSLPVLLGVGLFFGSLLLAYACYRKHPIVSFGILWFFIAISPTSNIAVPINGLLYEHWLYVPMIGVSLAVVYTGLLVFQAYGHRAMRCIVPISFVVVIMLLSGLAMKRNLDWHDPIVFYNQTLKYAPSSYRVINNLAMAYSDNREQGQAIEFYKKAIALDNTNPVAYHNLANAYEDLGDIANALRNYEIALALDAHFLFSYGHIINIYLNQKNYSEAKKWLTQYLAEDPNNTQAASILAALQRQGL